VEGGVGHMQPGRGQPSSPAALCMWRAVQQTLCGLPRFASHQHHTHTCPPRPQVHCGEHCSEGAVKSRSPAACAPSFQFCF
jgi:hypothetical protein